MSTWPVSSWPALLGTLLGRGDLSRDQTAWAMNEVMTGAATPAQIAAFVVALRAKGETVEEVAGLVETMLGHAVRIEVPGPTVDVVGTGGDQRHTVNISTMAALVVAGTGRRVVKHGNRAASSACGAADVLEALGLRLDPPPERVAELAGEVGITFCFAQAFHPALRHAGPTRRELGVPTVFNVLGPLTNPARPAAAAVGVADLRMAPIMAGVLAERGVRALVFRADDGLDELATTSPCDVWVVGAGTVRPDRFDALDVGMTRAQLSELTGGDPAHNAAVVRDVLAGSKGAIRDAVLLSAAAAVVAADGTAIDGRLSDAIAVALDEVTEALDDGRAGAVLDSWVTASQA